MRALAVRIALLLVSAAYVLLFFILSGARPAGDRAFSGVWSLGWNACCIGGGSAAARWPAGGRLPSHLRVRLPAPLRLLRRLLPACGCTLLMPVGILPRAGRPSCSARVIS